MALVQIRDVPEDVVEALKAQAAERGMTLAGYLRTELKRMAGKPTNAEIIDRIVEWNREHGSDISAEDIVATIRAARDAS